MEKIIQMKKEFNRIKDEYIKLLFNEIIKPFIDSRDLEIVWANGTFYITDIYGEDVKFPDSLDLILIDLVEEVYPHSKCCAVWDVLGSMYPSGCYNKNNGFADFEKRRR